MFKSSQNLRLAAEMRALQRVAAPWRANRTSWFDGTPESIAARLAATERVLTYAKGGTTTAHLALAREASTARTELLAAQHRLMVDFLDDGARAFRGSKRVANESPYTGNGYNPWQAQTQPYFDEADKQQSWADTWRNTVEPWPTMSGQDRAAILNQAIAEGVKRPDWHQQRDHKIASENTGFGAQAFKGSRRVAGFHEISDPDYGTISSDEVNPYTGEPGGGAMHSFNDGTGPHWNDPRAGDYYDEQGVTLGDTGRHHVDPDEPWRNTIHEDKYWDQLPTPDLADLDLDGYYRGRHRAEAAYHDDDEDYDDEDEPTGPDDIAYCPDCRNGSTLAEWSQESGMCPYCSKYNHDLDLQRKHGGLGPGYDGRPGFGPEDIADYEDYLHQHDYHTDPHDLHALEHRLRPELDEDDPARYSSRGQ